MLGRMDEARKVREFWFGKLPMGPDDLDRRMQLWFSTGISEDEQRDWDDSIREQFEPLVRQAVLGELAAWADGPRRRMSLILLLDQFPRNLYRGQARQFAGDEQALGLALSGMNSGADAALDVVERMFFYMPLQHCEVRDVQDESVAAYRRLLLEAPQPLKKTFQSSLDFAERHRNVIARFGRFPHRNKMLGRPSTPDEVTYLASGGETFSR